MQFDIMVQMFRRKRLNEILRAHLYEVLYMIVIRTAVRIMGFQSVLLFKAPVLEIQKHPVMPDKNATDLMDCSNLQKTNGF